MRQWVMGAEASDRAATADEIGAMRQLIRDGMQAGAIGFSTNQNPNHIDFRGKPVPECGRV